jgi:hypothetical protein
MLGSNSSSSSSGGLEDVSHLSPAGSSNTSIGRATAGTAGLAGGTKQAKWSHLLRLQQYHPQWAAAVADFDAKWGSYDCEALTQQVPNCDASAVQHVKQLYADILQLCRTLTAAAPITVVCNNPSCASWRE